MSGQKMEELKSEYLFLDNPVRDAEKAPEGNLYFAYCGFEECRPGHSYGPYARTNYVIHVIRKGRGTLVWNKKRYEASAGEMFILFPGETTFYHADEDDPWDYCWIGFRGSAAEQIVKEIGFTYEQPVLAFRNADAFSAIIMEMLQLRKRQLPDALRRQARLYELMALLIENAEICGIRRENMEDPELSYAGHALRYIQQHFSERIRVADIAAHIGISRGYLTRILKGATGMSPQEYLISVRMEHASRQLSHSPDPIRDVAQACGYSDSLAFSKAFKQYFGMSPREYHGLHYKKEDQLHPG